MRLAKLARCCAVVALALTSAQAANPVDFTLPAAVGGPPFVLGHQRGRVVVLHWLLRGDVTEDRNEIRDYLALAKTMPGVAHVFLKADSGDVLNDWANRLSAVASRLVFRDADYAVAKQFGLVDDYRYRGQTSVHPAIIALDSAGEEMFRYEARDAADRLPIKEFRARLSDALLINKVFREPRGDALSDGLLLSLREPLVLRELALDADQQAAVAKVLDACDSALWKLRDTQLVKPDAAAEAWALVDQVEVDVRQVLRPEQRIRLDQIAAQARALDALLAPRVAEQLKLTAEQLKRIGQMRAATREGERVMRAKEAGSAGLDARVTEYLTNQRNRLLALLGPEQNLAYGRLGGKAFDFSSAHTRFAKAPELRGVTNWLNGEATTLAALRGKVVVVQFFTVGCVNCVHNQPPVLGWRQRFVGKDVVVLGIHTPETEGERDQANVRKGLDEQKVDYLVAVDNDKANWDAWANHTWPSVYLIDKAGYVRSWWYGELNWEGAGGEKLFGDHIAALLAEPADAP
ncbi:MAG: redoxin domain-containing protein [Armatimonadetes bacterium]|nr:redoxin domain-containing protein [Armatimonadota bacterium]